MPCPRTCSEVCCNSQHSVILVYFSIKCRYVLSYLFIKIQTVQTCNNKKINKLDWNIFPFRRDCFILNLFFFVFFRFFFWFFFLHRKPQIFPMTEPIVADKPCGHLCHQRVRVGQGPAPLHPFTQADQVILKAFLTEEAVDEDQTYTYCDMAIYSGRACHETHQVIRELINVPEEVDSYNPDDVKSHRPRNGRGGPRKNNRRNQNIAPAGKRMRLDLKNAGQVKQYQYIPCSHGRGAHCGDGDSEICQ